MIQFRKSLHLLDLQSKILPISIFLSSLIGSWHCAGMCGAIACSASLKGRSHFYHFGRMLSYTTLGGLSGFFGQALISSETAKLHTISVVLMGTALVLLGLSFFMNSNLKLLNMTRFLYPLIQRAQNQQFILGLVTGLLPCGWLYTFVIAAAATKSPVSGALCLFLFWLGTVPSLTLMSSGFSNLMKYQSKKIRLIAGSLLFFAGFYSIIAHFYIHKM